ncbi:putative type IX secretion system sortase PorU2 [Pseudocnuella soli]|uniref:putative type IX secretion system sortase PorU2 n=1 Tax=Pseudocnuella soli TaxID=2502779 RepID=UPI0010516B9C|nr:C25 family cysteine peptidase [Pseudocnuella soli]
MKKFLFALLTLCCGMLASAQVYNNEWIDHSKTYYKVKVGRNGLHRISKAELDTVGLGTVPAEHFQVWRNGSEVPIFTSAPTGALPNDGFIEFYGERNDGVPDRALYRRQHYQLNDRISLFTDTAIYFLTVNPTGNNRRIQAQTNDLTGNTLAPLPYFTYTHVQSYNNQLNGGYAVDVETQYLYSSAYDLGEGYTSANIGTNATNSTALGNLFVATTGPAAQFKITVAGSRIALRRYRVRINADSVLGNSVDHFNYATDSAEVPLRLISGTTNSVQVTNLTNTASDRMVIHKFELTYPRLFNFGNATNFEFTLPESSVPRYIEITNFNIGGQQPVLLDLENGQRYLGNTAVSGKVRILLQPSARPGRFVLCSQAAALVTQVPTLTERKFVDYTRVENQGDFLIISNQLLFNNGAGTNMVEEYRQYRSSAAGGSHSARIYDVEELVDQFAFGIKKNPLGIRNFILFSLQRFSEKPKHVFLVGKGTTYNEQRSREANPQINQLNLVPTFGNPASDILLAAAPGTAVPLVSIGRLSAVSPAEITDYLAKVKQYEAAQAAPSPDPAVMTWKKNVAHIIGSGDPNLQNRLEVHMAQCKDIISDTLWGAQVHTFTKKTGQNVEQISDKGLEHLFEEGLSLITYFGHSSNSGLDFNLDNPSAYNNTGKYPLFVALGCQAGGIFGFNANRFAAQDAISEKYVLAPQKGTISFIANSHFGIVSTLRVWNNQFYKQMSVSSYGKTIGETLTETAIKTLAETINGEENFYVRVNIEESILHGDPAVKLNVEAKPDYAITEPMVKVNPTFVSVAETAFKLNVEVRNLGKAIAQKWVLSIKRKLPNGTEKEVIRDSVDAPLHTSVFEYSIPIDALQDVGLNKLTVTVDAAEQVAELFETNNSVTKDIFIYQDEARPIYPYNFAIVNKPEVQLAFSTADAFSARRNYQVEMDTTELFNSSAKWSQTVSSVGGVIEVKPSVSLRNNTVYYWRVGAVPDSGDLHWNRSSFIYIENGEAGFNQSHLYQQLKSSTEGVLLDSVTSKWTFTYNRNEILVRNGVFPSAASDAGDFLVSINSDNSQIRSVCGVSNIIVNVIDPNTMKPWFNGNSGQQGRFGSDVVCGQDRAYNFQFNILQQSSRKSLFDFLSSLPDKYLVIVRNTSGTAVSSNSYANQWKADTATWGSGNSLYHILYKNGFSQVDSFSRPRSWIFMYKKNDASFFQPKFVMSEGTTDKIQLLTTPLSLNSSGLVTSPTFGPAKSWKNFIWKGVTDDASDVVEAKIVGITPNGRIDTLVRNIKLTDTQTDISTINADSYPSVRLVMKTMDSTAYTPFQIDYWRLTYDPVPEGAVAPNLFFNMKDSLDVGEMIDFKLAFKNLSGTPFDSLKIKMVVTDKNNVPHQLPILRHKPLSAGDTLHVRYPINTQQFAGMNMLYVQVNPDADQPEQFSFNNFIYHSFYVQDDRTAPVVDVTFDNVRILNRDIVSAKPDILIKLTDESKRLLLNDTALFKVQVRNLTSNVVRSFSFGTDTLKMNPATDLDQNVASVTFKPYFAEDGEYELIVAGEDRSGNKAGNADYRVQFQVINKPMISNMLNYPNPFTTSTAFVFTLTGTEIPQNLKIQILTVTGKVVREITRQELGLLRIGRNITEFKWDGTDQFGQKLGNGVYLYRVIAQLNGKPLDKYKASGDQTDQYFNKGYGKMYLMR